MTAAILEALAWTALVLGLGILAAYLKRRK